jgi:CheY-like chemotaxis protein
MSRILAIDDDLEWLTYLRKLLTAHGHAVKVLNNAAGVIETAKSFAPELVITDIMMPGISGSTVQAMLRDQYKADLPIIVCSSTKLKVRAEDAFLVHCPKAEAPDNLLPTIELMLESSRSHDSTTSMDSATTPEVNPA